MADIQAFLQTPGNDSCADCDSTQLLYFSSEFGVVLCETCAETHQYEQLSTVIALADQPSIPAYSGNSAFNAYLATYNIDKSAPQEFKYRTKAAFLYKSKLADGENPVSGEPLPLEEALILEPKPVSAVNAVIWGAVEVAREAGSGVYEGLNEFTKRPTMHWLEQSAISWLESFQSRINAYVPQPPAATPQQGDTELRPI